MRLFITLFYSLLLFCTIFSCRDESSSIGSKWVESSFINVVTDTCMVTLSTLLADSLATSGDTICQIGRRNRTKMIILIIANVGLIKQVTVIFQRESLR